MISSLNDISLKSHQLSYWNISTYRDSMYISP